MAGRHRPDMGLVPTATVLLNLAREHCHLDLGGVYIADIIFGSSPDTREGKELAETLDGKVAVVTGAGSGIGRAVAESFRNAGMRVVVNGRSAKKLATYTPGDDLVAVAADIALPDTAERLLETAKQRFGGCEIFVNNAGVVEQGSIDDIDIDAMCAMVRVNVEAAFRAAYVFARHLRAKGTGHLITTSSILGTKVRPIIGAYAGTKYAVEAMTEGLRMDLADTDVKVSCIQPGLVMTDLHDHMSVHPKDAIGMHEPLTPRDIAECVMFMVTRPRNVFIPRMMIVPKETAM